MASGMKNTLKDKLQDGELDLSMMQYTDVPFKEIEQLGGKVTTLNLSHNLLACLPTVFPLLSHLVKLDLSKNQLSQLPDNFGQLRSLRWLDLYANRLTRLPVSFAQLKNLKWLDLKDNLLVPAIQQAAGPCITPNDCAMCAKKVVALLQSMESQLQRERQRKMVMEQEALQERGRMEDLERERVRQEKRDAKERRREEQKQREEERRLEENKNRQEMQINGSGSSIRPLVNGVGNDHGDSGMTRVSPASQTWCYALLMFLMGVSAVGLALAVSLVLIYSEGKLDTSSVQAALITIQTDMEDYFTNIVEKLSMTWDNAVKIAKPYVERGIKSGTKAWQEGGKIVRKSAKYVEKHYEDWFASVGSRVVPYMELANNRMRSALMILWKGLRPPLETAWEWFKPYFRELGKIIIDNGQVVWDWLDEAVPLYVDWVSDIAVAAARMAEETWREIVQRF